MKIQDGIQQKIEQEARHFYENEFHTHPERGTGDGILWMYEEVVKRVIWNPLDYGIDVPAWIACSDTLPDTGMDTEYSTDAVIIKVKSPAGHINISTARRQYGKWHWWNGKEMSADFEVIAWMPMPSEHGFDLPLSQVKEALGNLITLCDDIRKDKAVWNIKVLTEAKYALYLLQRVM